ncbi:MAG: Ig-like domain-containing protein [Oscillibacter sp.]|nr:Ig-like domain-containing protein [Oscillibacter sp.]
MRKTRNQKRFSLFLSLVLLLSLCVPSRAAETGGEPAADPDTGDSNTEQQVTIELDATTQELEPNTIASLKATVTPAAEVTWEISTPGVIRQESAEGDSFTFRAVNAGSTDIIARAGEVSARCAVTVSGVVITPASLSLEVPGTATVSMETFGKAKEAEAASWRWASDAPERASVQITEGVVTVRAIGEGSATITCTNGTYTGSCPVTVKAEPQVTAEVTLSQTALVLSQGQTGTLTATSNANPEDIKWTMENTGIATVSPESGNEVTVTAVATGETRLSVRAGSGPVTPCTVIVSGIAFSSETVTVTAGRTTEVSVLTYGDSREIPVSSWEWRSGDTSIAAVTPTSTGGTVRGIQAGKCTLTLTVGAYTATCTVNVEAADTSLTVSLSESTITMAPGTSSRLRATTLADSADIKWTIANPDITQIAGKTGYTIVLAAGNPGQTTITAQVGDSEPASCAIVVSGVTLSTNSIAMTVNGMENIILTSYGDAQTIPAWEWSSSNTGVAIVTQTASGATVRGVGAGSSTITCTGGSYTVLCQVSVAANKASDLEANLNGGILKMSTLLSELKSICQTMTDESLSYITNLSVDTKLGTLYEGYVSEGDTGFGVASNRNYYVSDSAHMISNVTFVPKPDVNGIVRINYDGFTVNNKTFTGSVLVSVGQQENTLAYASLNGAPIHFRSEDFFNYSMSVYNRSLQYLTFTMPASRYGTLYYSYVNSSVYESIVSGGTRYYRTYNPSISNVAFVPNPAYSGNFSLYFTGYDTEGVNFIGTVRISVNNPNGSDTGEELRERLHYETGPGARVYFEAKDFIDECKERTGYELVSIHFRSLPSSGTGRVYTSRTGAAHVDTEYGVSRLGNLNFVARKNYTGSFTIPFTATTDRDTAFSGQIYMTVSDDGAYLIRMSATSGTRLYLSTADFSDISRVATEKEFHHVGFPSLPETGALYYDNGANRVTEHTLYYRSGTEPYLSNVNYLAPDTFTGTVRVPYNLWNTEGESVTGHLLITVQRPGLNSASGAFAAYSTSGPALAIRAADILSPAQKEIGNVVSIRLTPPSPAAGKLLLNYLSPGLYSPFDSTRDYTPDTLGQIYFLPKAGFRGAATITYIARNIHNLVYSGILRIQVLPPERSAYFTDLTNRSWAVPAVDFFRYYNVLNGTTPTTYEPDGPARRGAYITVLGRMYNFPNYPGNGGYDDVEPNFYYTPYISAGRALGVTEASQYFRPGEAISRQDAAVYLYRCLVRAGQAPSPRIENLSRFHDGYLVSYYAMEAMSALVELGVFQGTENGYLNPYSTLTRLQMAAILYRAMT